MHGSDLSWILAILLDHSPTGKVTDGDDVIGLVHPVHLDTEYCGIDIASTAVKVCGMYVHHEWLSRHLLGMDTSGIGQPVMGVNDVTGLGTCDHTCYDAVVIDLLEEVVGILARELDGTEVICPEVGEVRIDMNYEIGRASCRERV